MEFLKKGNKTIMEALNMAEDKKGNKPLDTYRAGAIKVTCWQNEVDFKGQKRMMKSFQLSKSYKDGDDWKESKSYNLNDLPKVISLLQKAYNDGISKSVDDD
jgi:hypothetical protein